MKLMKVLPASIIAAALAALGGTSVAGAAVSGEIGLDPCVLVQPDATLSLGPAVPAVEASSTVLGDAHLSDPERGVYDGPAYLSWLRPCRQFVVDVQVPPNSWAPGFKPAFNLAADSPVGARCGYYERRTTVYRRDPGDSTFSYLGSVDQYSRWQVDGSCALVPFYEDDPWPSSFSPPRTGRTAATYRIVTRAMNDWGHSWYGWEALHRTVRAAHLPEL